MHRPSGSRVRMEARIRLCSNGDFVFAPKKKKREGWDSIVIKSCHLLFGEKRANNLWMRDERLYKQLDSSRD